MSDRELLAALDACRPGESEWDDPALGDVAHRLETDEAARQLRGRVEDADRRLEAALHAVEPPAGLADRLLSRLAAARASGAPDTSDAPASGQTVDTNRTVPSAAGRGRWRRRAFLASGVAAMAATVMLAIHLWPEPPQPWTAEQVLDAAIGLYTRDSHSGGKPLDEAPGDRKPSSDLIELPPNTQWRRIEDALAGSDAIAYDIELAPGPTRGTLYVISPAAAVTGLADYPPSQPATPTTQGVCAAAWQGGVQGGGQDGGLVYVLVVEGGQAEYQRFLRTNRGTFASIGRGLRLQRSNG